MSEIKKFRVTASSLNVRDNPLISGNIVGKLNNNEVVEAVAISADGKWLKISKSNLVGWASARFLKEVIVGFKIKRAEFFDNYRRLFGTLTQNLVEALEDLLTQIEADSNWSGTDTEMRQLAYALATFKWETAHTLRPIDEFGGDNYFNNRYGPQTKVGKKLGNTQDGDGARFHGRGFVQLTGRANYKRAGDNLGLDLTNNPELVKQPDIAYKIAMLGMRQGWFTGKKFSNYFKDGFPPDYFNARRIINGLDQANTIEGIARKFVEILRFSKL